MKWTKTILTPSGERFVLQAEYDYNLQSVLPLVHGDVGALCRLVEEPCLPAIEGVHFEGWMRRILSAKGCRVSDTHEGTWKMLVE